MEQQGKNKGESEKRGTSREAKGGGGGGGGGKGGEGGGGGGGGRQVVYLHVVGVVDGYFGKELQLIGASGGVPGHVVRLQLDLPNADAPGHQQVHSNSCQNGKQHLHTCTMLQICMVQFCSAFAAQVGPKLELVSRGLWLLLGTEAPVWTPNGLEFSNLSYQELETCCKTRQSTEPCFE